MPVSEADRVIYECYIQMWEERLWQKFLVEQPENTTFDKYMADNLGLNKKEAKKKRVISKAESEEAARGAALFFGKGG